MKIASLVILIVLLSSLTPAQNVSLERDFERERRSLSLVHFAIGEDATSGTDYLVYKRRSQIRKIRSVWNGGCCSAPTVEDFYFKDGSPALYVKLAATKGQLRRIVRGNNIPLKTEEKIYLRGSKLTTWVENGRAISSSNPRWKEREKTLLDAFKDQLETYQSYLEDR